MSHPTLNSRVESLTKEKPKRTWIRSIDYSQKHWNLLHEKRKKATKILKVLSTHNIKGYVYGSVTRGDCGPKSDIDIIIFSPPTPFILERIFKEHFSIYAKEISQATPKLAIKAHFHLDPKTTISFPLTKLSTSEREFYSYGGKITLPQIRNPKKRTPGIDKRLILIRPTKNGHKEISIHGKEKMVANIVNVPISLVQKRKRLLMRRDRKGRNGPYVQKKLGKKESFNTVLRQIASKRPSFREQLREHI